MAQSLEQQDNSRNVRRFLNTYRDLFTRHSARGEPPPIAWEKEGKLVQGLLQQYGYDRLVELLEAFFASEDTWVRRRGYALSCFPSQLPSLLMVNRSPAEASRRVRATPVVLHSPSARHWEKPDDLAPTAPLSTRFPDLADKLRSLT